MPVIAAVHGYVLGAGLRCVVTLSSYTGDEDMREAALVVTSLADLEACLAGPTEDEEAV